MSFTPPWVTRIWQRGKRTTATTAAPPPCNRAAPPPPSLGDAIRKKLGIERPTLRMPAPPIATALRPTRVSPPDAPPPPNLSARIREREKERSAK